MFDQYNQPLIQASYGALSLSADVAVLPEVYLPYDANVEDNFTYYEAPAVEVGWLLLLLPVRMFVCGGEAGAAPWPCSTPPRWRSTDQQRLAVARCRPEMLMLMRMPTPTSVAGLGRCRRGALDVYDAGAAGQPPSATLPCLERRPGGRGECGSRQKSQHCDCSGESNRLSNGACLH